jgi:hypothetical protein
MQTASGTAGEGARFAQRCARLTSPRAMFRLLRHSVVPRMTYTLRTVSARQTAAPAQQWDGMTQWVLERSMGLHPAEQSWDSFVQAGAPYVLQGAMLQQARLPARLGGLGISSACDIADAAYIASTLQALPPVLSAWAGVLCTPNAAAQDAGGEGVQLGAAAAAAAAPAAADAGAAAAGSIRPPQRYRTWRRMAMRWRRRLPRRGRRKGFNLVQQHWQQQQQRRQQCQWRWPGDRGQIRRRCWREQRRLKSPHYLLCRR